MTTEIKFLTSPQFMMALDALAECIKTSKGIICLGDYWGKTRYTTPAILECERQMLANVDFLRQAAGSVADLGLMKKVVGQSPDMTDEQRRAVEHLTRAPRPHPVTRRPGWNRKDQHDLEGLQQDLEEARQACYWSRSYRESSHRTGRSHRHSNRYHPLASGRL